LAWCKSLLADNPGMVPIRHGYSYTSDGLDEYFGVEPVRNYNWMERDGMDAQEGYAAAAGVIVDGAEIGTAKDIWLELPDEGNDVDSDGDDDNDVSQVHTWRENNAAKYREREALAELIAADVNEYLADIGTNAAIPAAQLTANQLRAAVWFEVFGYADSEEIPVCIDDTTWEPLAWAWERVMNHIAKYVAAFAAENITQMDNGDRDTDTDRANAAALAAMFGIPLDMIGEKAADALHKATNGEQGADSQNNAGVAETMEDSPEAAAPVIAVDVETLTDPEDTITVDGAMYTQIPTLPV
jgi:hypothetical protein